MKPVYRLTKVFCNGVLYILFMIQFCTISTVHGQIFSFSNHRKKDVIHFTLIKNLVIIPLFIDDKGPYNFILDTGVSPIIITDPTIIDSLDFKTLKSIQLSGLGEGLQVAAFLTNAVTTKIGHATASNIPTAILKQDIFNLSDYVGMRIHGLVGYYFFNSFLVKINYPNKKISYFLPGTNTRMRGEKIPVTLINDKPYMNALAALGTQDSVNLKLIIDMGASHALSLETWQQKNFPLPPVTIPANLGMGIGGRISGNIGRIPSLTFGSFSFKNVLTAFPRYEDAGAKIGVKERNGNLGADVLRHFHLTIDYKNLAFYFNRNRYYKNTFEHDMSGMEIYLEEGKSNHYFVGRIDAGSPADLAGITLHDEVLSINLTKMDQLGLDGACGILKAGAGRRIIVELVRDKKWTVKVFTLKRRI